MWVRRARASTYNSNPPPTFRRDPYLSSAPALVVPPPPTPLTDRSTMAVRAGSASPYRHFGEPSRSPKPAIHAHQADRRGRRASTMPPSNHPFADVAGDPSLQSDVEALRCRFSAQPFGDQRAAEPHQYYTNRYAGRNSNRHQLSRAGEDILHSRSALDDSNRFQRTARVRTPPRPRIDPHPGHLAHGTLRNYYHYNNSNMAVNSDDEENVGSPALPISTLSPPIAVNEHRFRDIESAMLDTGMYKEAGLGGVWTHTSRDYLGPLFMVLAASSASFASIELWMLGVATIVLVFAVWMSIARPCVEITVRVHEKKLRYETFAPLVCPCVLRSLVIDFSDIASVSARREARRGYTGCDMMESVVATIKNHGELTLMATLRSCTFSSHVPYLIERKAAAFAYVFGCPSAAVP